MSLGKKNREKNAQGEGPGRTKEGGRRHKTLAIGLKQAGDALVISGSECQGGGQACENRKGGHQEDEPMGGLYETPMNGVRGDWKTGCC